MMKYGMKMQVKFVCVGLVFKNKDKKLFIIKLIYLKSLKKKKL